jgi:uncharacterized surface protein with fasciclin (FAS1) repeats
MQFTYTLLVSLATIALAQTQQSQSLTDILTSTPQLSSLTSFLQKYPDLVDSLSKAKDITILAPTDDAFKALLASDAGKAVAGDADYIKALLTYHVLNGTVKSTDIKKTGAFVPSLLVDEKYSNVTGGQVVEGVLVDDKVVFNTGLLANATVKQAVCRPFSLPLLFIILPFKHIDANITLFQDITFTGGVIHIINSVLTLPASVSTTLNAAKLTSLRDAVNATSLISTLNTTPDLTIFAPTNEAFAAISSTTQKLNTTELAGVLAYHVINGTVGYSSALKDGMKLKTVNGAELVVTIRDGSVFVNAAKVVIADVLIGNGVVHVLDKYVYHHHCSPHLFIPLTIP